MDEADAEGALRLHKSRGAARSAPPSMSALSARRRLMRRRAFTLGICSSLSFLAALVVPVLAFPALVFPALVFDCGHGVAGN